MRRAYRRWRCAIALGLVSWNPCAWALNPALDVSQYAHTAWKIRDGFTKGSIQSIAQTADGYLWLGTEFGLVRFDGVRAVPWQPPADQPLPSSGIRSLLVGRDGTLWIGTEKGLVSWKDGKLTRYPKLADLVPGRLLEDRKGTIWLGAFGSSVWRLCSIRNGDVRCFGEAAVGYGLFEDSTGTIWAGTSGGVWSWAPGPRKFYSVPGEPNGIQGLAEGDDGTLLMSMVGGVRRLIDGKAKLAIPFPPSLRHYQAPHVLRDRDGAFWVGTSGGGLVHIHQNRTDVFARSDNLSGDFVYTFFEDREGNIWVATAAGLDRFRDSAVATFSVDQGLSNDSITSVLAARDGSIWIGTFAGLNRWDHGHVTIYRERRGRTRPGVREIVGRGLPDLGVHSLFQDDRAKIWVSTRRGVGYLEDDRLVPIPGVPGGNVVSIVKDKRGELWIALTTAGMSHLLPDHVLQQIPWGSFGARGDAADIVSDPQRDGLWLGFFQGGLAYFEDRRIREEYRAANGLGSGRVNQLQFSRDGALWVATEGGLSRLKNGRVATLTSANGLPCDSVHWAIEDDSDAFWLFMPCGLARVARSEVDAWAAAVENRKAAKMTIQATVFDSSDGVRTRSFPGGYHPQVAKSSDGKLWFATQEGLSVIDPRRLHFNKLPPLVYIEQITANRRLYSTGENGHLRLAPLVRDLEIDYTALSLVAPEKIRFRYKLEGQDPDWKETLDRKAVYSNLPPRNYRFHVMASNNSGVWNETGASLDFSVAPAYYQTTWFRSFIVAAVLALLASLYQLRQRQVTRHLHIRMEGQVAERTRIARDLHDTLLQSFQGVLLKFSTFKYLMRSRPEEAEETLERLIEQARAAITEGRDAVEGLRSSTVVANDLGRAIATFGNGLADQTGQNCPGFSVQLEGKSRDLPPSGPGRSLPHCLRIAAQCIPARPRAADRSGNPV